MLIEQLGDVLKPQAEALKKQFAVCGRVKGFGSNRKAIVTGLCRKRYE
jgi:hypothetical protein